MSEEPVTDETGGLVLTPPRPQLLVLVPVDGPAGRHDPRGSAARGATRTTSRRGWSGAGPGCAELLGPSPSPCRSTSRPSSRRTATATGGTRSCSTPRTPCRCPAYLLVPDDRVGAPPGCRRARLPRPRAGQVAGGRARAHRHAQRRLRAPAGPPRLRRAGAGPALLRRAAGLESRGPLRLRHQPGARRHGGVEPAGPERVGPAALPRRAGAAPAGRPGPDGHGRHLVRGHGHARSPPPSTAGWPPPW